jgi:hypothetical protein
MRVVFDDSIYSKIRKKLYDILLIPFEGRFACRLRDVENPTGAPSHFVSTSSQWRSKDKEPSL